VRLEDAGIFALQKEKPETVTVKEFTVGEEMKQHIQEISEVPSNLQNFYQAVTSQDEKLPQLLAFLDKMAPQRLIVFFGTCASVDFHVLALRLLCPDKCTFFKLHGKIDQKKRSKIYNEFKSQEKPDKHQVLLTTDLAARGIDIPDVDWIIQYDPPQDSD